MNSQHILIVLVAVVILLLVATPVILVALSAWRDHLTFKAEASAQIAHLRQELATKINPPTLLTVSTSSGPAASGALPYMESQVAGNAAAASASAPTAGSGQTG